MREQLIAIGREGVARVYDALIAQRWPVERVFTEAQALRALQPLGIGRRTLRAALQSQAFVHLAETRVTGGRPARQFQARTISGLQSVFYIAPDVPPSQAHVHPATATDRLRPGDLRWGQYKKALYREVIRRRDGLETSRQWLASLLSVCARTLRRWQRALHVRSERSLEYHVLTRSMLADLPTDLPKHRPIWLEAMGKRFRATQHTATWLLNQTIDVLIVRQHPNKYSLPPMA